MNCEIIKDLIPLYIDRCCSEESANEVEKHLKECENCKSIFDMMNSENLKEKNESFEIKKLSKINERKASVLQSVLLFISFIVMALLSGCGNNDKREIYKELDIEQAEKTYMHYAPTIREDVKSVTDADVLEM